VEIKALNRRLIHGRIFHGRIRPRAKDTTNAATKEKSKATGNKIHGLEVEPSLDVVALFSVTVTFLVFVVVKDTVAVIGNRTTVVTLVDSTVWVSEMFLLAVSVRVSV